MVLETARLFRPLRQGRLIDREPDFPCRRLEVGGQAGHQDETGNFRI